jgi:hypothetical protein
MIKHQLGEFLRESLKLQLSEPKTLITHARSRAARFLGYEIVVLHDDRRHDRRGHRTLNGTVGLKVPVDVVHARCGPYLHGGKPFSRRERLHDTVSSVVAQYQQEFRGFAEYYRLAFNLHRLSRLEWVMKQSLTHTLAHKLRISVQAVCDRYQTTIRTAHSPRRVLQVEVGRGEGKAPLVAQWGDVSLARRENASLNDRPPRVWNTRSELLERLLADRCELCDSQVGIEVHHVRHLKDLQRRGRARRPAWVETMAARHRKTLVVCRGCHDEVHHGRSLHQRRVTAGTGEPDLSKG